MLNFVNLTPHDIIVRSENGDRVFQPSGQVARLNTRQINVTPIEGIPVVVTQLGVVEGLPEPKNGIFYIVSSLIAQAVRNRPDVFSPDTGPTAIRDEDKQIVAVIRFQTFTSNWSDENFTSTVGD